MMTMTVTGSCVSVCAGFCFSGTSVSFVSGRTGLEFTGREFLRERKFCAAGEKKQANNYTRAPDMSWPVCEGAAKPTRFRPSGGKCAAPWHCRSASHFCVQVLCRYLKILESITTYPSRHVDINIVKVMTNVA
jgi:hypothetical protein